MDAFTSNRNLEDGRILSICKDFSWNKFTLDIKILKQLNGEGQWG
jgi:hypothetical protein